MRKNCGFFNKAYFWESWKFAIFEPGVARKSLRSNYILTYIVKSCIWMLQRHVIWWSIGNFVGLPRIILKIVKHFPMKRNSHFSREWQIWPTRYKHLTLNFEANMASNIKYYIILIQISYCNGFFFASDYRPFCYRLDFVSKARIFAFRSIFSIEVWG